MVIKYTKIFHSKTVQNLPKLGFLVWKQTIWQPWLCHSDIHVFWKLVPKSETWNSESQKVSVIEVCGMESDVTKNNGSLWEYCHAALKSEAIACARRCLVIPVDRVVDKKRIIRQKGKAMEKERHKGWLTILTQKVSLSLCCRKPLFAVLLFSLCNRQKIHFVFKTH
jgi:hypothetical protein